MTIRLFLVVILGMAGLWLLDGHSILLIRARSTLNQAAPQVTIGFSGVVSSIEGPEASQFHVGEHLHGSYTIFTGAPDLAPSGDSKAQYHQALISATVDFPDTKQSFTHAWRPWVLGDVVISDDFWDQYKEMGIYAAEYKHGTLLGGEAPCCMELDFTLPLHDGVARTPPPIADITPPDKLLDYRRGSISLHSRKGWTELYFEPDQARSPPLWRRWLHALLTD
ncbi:MAG: hypothetical protein JO218_03615 [Burkholderiales bacterium]|nr:hypothetical protein [Burkholderiales bacterium]